MALNSQENLLRLRMPDGTSIGYAYVTTAGMLAFHNDMKGTNSASATGGARAGTWSSCTSLRTVERDARPARCRSGWTARRSGTSPRPAVDIGTTPIGAMQIGEVQAGKSFDVAFDDAAFGTSRLGVA